MRKLLHQPVNLLGLAGEPKLCQEQSQRGQQIGGAIKLHQVRVRVHDRDGKVSGLAEILADHGHVKPVVLVEEVSNAPRVLPDEPVLLQERNTLTETQRKGGVGLTWVYPMAVRVTATSQQEVRGRSRKGLNGRDAAF